MLSIEEVINRLLLDKDVMHDAVHYLQSYRAEIDKLLYKLEALKESHDMWNEKTEWVQKHVNLLSLATTVRTFCVCALRRLKLHWRF